MTPVKNRKLSRQMTPVKNRSKNHNSLRTKSQAKRPETPLKIALVCDWLDTVGGAERVLLALHELYPTAPIYTSHYSKKGIDWFKNVTIKTGWLQIFPTCLRRFLGVFRTHYFSHLNLTDYDLVISVTGAEAKAVKAKKHLCYCHVPTQYYWHLYDEYMESPGFGPLNPLVRFALKILVKPLRKKDYAAAQRPTKIITTSKYSQDLIKKYYNRESQIIPPPVDTKKFSTSKQNKIGNCQAKKTEQVDSEIKSKKSQTSTTITSPNNSQTPLRLIATSRQVTWKRLDLCIEACKKTGDILTLIGDGPEHKRLLKIAKNHKNIIFLPTMPQEKLAQHLKNADAYLFPSLEPFGLAPVEALAAGCPVIAYGAGGALDYVHPSENGLLFESQTVASLVSAIEKFREAKKSTDKGDHKPQNSTSENSRVAEDLFNQKKIAASALPYDVENFKAAIKTVVKKTTQTAKSGTSPSRTSKNRPRSPKK